jgi:Tfp pilus assembly protein PilV
MVTGRAQLRAGVVLVDVLVAAIMLGVSLTVLITMTGRALSSQRQGEHLATAAMLIDQQLNLVLAHGPDDYTSRYPASGQCDVPFDRYSYALEFSGGEGGNAYSVIATVSWSDAGRPNSVSVETMIAPRLGDDPDPDRRPEQPAVRGY